MKIRFTKDIEVNYWNSQFSEEMMWNFRQGAVVNVSEIDRLDRNFANLYFENGDIAIEVPVNSYESVS